MGRVVRVDGSRAMLGAASAQDFEMVWDLYGKFGTNRLWDESMNVALRALGARGCV
jgi:hypothetical protein